MVWNGPEPHWVDTRVAARRARPKDERDHGLAGALDAFPEERLGCGRGGGGLGHGGLRGGWTACRLSIAAFERPAGGGGATRVCVPAREPLRERPSAQGEQAVQAAPVAGRLVLFVMIAVGLSMVLGVGVFAALTRPPRRSHPAPAAATCDAGVEPSFGGRGFALGGAMMRRTGGERA